MKTSENTSTTTDTSSNITPPQEEERPKKVEPVYERGRCEEINGIDQWVEPLDIEASILKLYDHINNQEKQV